MTGDLQETVKAVQYNEIINELPRGKPWGFVVSGVFMGEYLKPDSQSIKVGSTVLAGVIVGIEVSGELRLERQKTDGKSGSTTLIKGHEEASIRISLELLGGDEEVKKLESVFKGAAGQLGSKGVRVVNRHLDARGVKKLVFKKLTTRDDYPRGKIIADLEFTEFDMEAARLEEKDKSGGGALGSGLGTGANGQSGAGAKGQNGAGGSATGKPGVENPIIAIAQQNAKTDYNNIKTDPLGTMFGWSK